MTVANAIAYEDFDDALKINVSVDEKRFTKKPDKPTMIKISNRIASYPRYAELERLPEIIGERGFSWCPATFTDGKRKISNFKSQQLFALDFDKGITWEEVQERASKYRLPISFAYETLSSMNKSKFRVALCCDVEITSDRAARVIQIALMEIFPECDPNCKDCSRLFLGGKGLIYVNENINTALFNISDLMLALVEYYRDIDNGNNNVSRKIKKYAENVGIELKNGFPRVEILEEEDISEIKTDVLGASPIIYNNKGNAPETSKTYYAIYLTNKIKKTKVVKTGEGQEEVVIYETVNTKTGKRDLIRNFNFDRLKEACRLFSEFAEGKRWCYHPELWGMATNLCQIKGGGDKFIQILTDKVNEQYESYMEKDWEYYINYIQKQDYLPQRCVNFCPYAEECNHAKNMIMTAKTRRNTIVKLSNNYEYATLSEGEKNLHDTFVKLQAVKDDKIHVIKAQTGIGKSRTYIGCLDKEDRPYIIAVPTNKLKEEIYKKCTDAGYHVVMTPTLPSDIPEYIKNEIERLYSIGATYTAGKYIRKAAKEKGLPQLLEYIEQMETVKSFQGHIITTHSRLLYFKSKQFQTHNILIDEDIIKTLLQVNKVSIKDLLKIQQHKYISSMDKLEIDRKFKYIFQDNDYQTFIKTNPISFNNMLNFEKQIADYESEINSNVIGFLNCCVAYRYNTDKKKMAVKGYYSDGDMIQYLVKRELPKQKIIIMSATADEQIYKRMFGERVEFHYCKKAKYKGKLIQYPARSYSRQCIENDSELMDIAKSIVGDIPIITFKAKKENEEDLNFGSTEGHNCFEGQDIAVVGTPHLHEIVYKMYAVALDIDMSDTEMKYQEIERNGYKFWFMTYKNEDLRNLQMWLIESELEQAVGRARLLRNNCSVFLFSNYPLEQAEFRYL